MEALLFPGQGSQFVGLGKDLAEASAAAARVFETADRVLGYALSEIMFGGPEETLRETRNAQPAILAHSIAVWTALGRPLGEGDYIGAGHSLGEYSAYTIAGALRYEDALKVVRRRGELMHAAGLKRPGTMAAVLGSDFETVQSTCREVPGEVGPANINSPGQIVISGEIEAVRATMLLLKERGAKRVVELNVSGAFHSPLMAPAADGLRAALAEIELNDARFPVYANASAEPVMAAEDIRASLVKQLLSPVRWEPSIRAMIAAQPTGFSEIGPGAVLKGLLRQIDRDQSCQAIGTAEQIEASHPS